MTTEEAETFLCALLEQFGFYAVEVQYTGQGMCTATFIHASTRQQFNASFPSADIRAADRARARLMYIARDTLTQLLYAAAEKA